MNFFQAFAKNAGLQQEVTDELVNELVSYLVDNCIPYVMASLNASKKKGSTSVVHVTAQPVEDLVLEIVKKITASPLRGFFQNIAITKKVVSINEDWLKEIGNGEDQYFQAFGRYKERRMFYPHPMSKELFLHRNSYGDEIRLPSIVCAVKQLNPRIKTAIVSRMKKNGIDVDEDAPFSDLDRALKAHFGHMYEPKGAGKGATEDSTNEISTMLQDMSKDQLQNVLQYTASLCDDEKDKNPVEKDDDSPSDDDQYNSANESSDEPAAKKVKATTNGSMN
jgi:hypothetical protein